MPRSVERPRAQMEALDRRVLLHGGTLDSDPTPGSFHLDVNFQPAGAPIPDGYLPDYGAVYGDRGNGFTYGWDQDNSINARDKDSPLSPDQAYDTFIHMQKSGSRTWSALVPNGTFDVHIVSGDAGYIDSVYKINAEGVLTVNGTPTSAQHWVEGEQAAIAVSDGKLTISNASGSSNNKINFIDITQVADPVIIPPPSGPFEAHINFQPAGVPIPSGYFADTGLVFGDRGNGFSYGWDLDNTAWTRDRDSSLSPDQRYDTLDHFQKNGSRTWEIAIPNGSYSVHIASGDSDFTDGIFKTNAEGVLVVNGTPTAANHWVEGTQTVTVSDGRLTVTSASGASGNKINFIDITPAAPPPPGPNTVSFSTPDATATETPGNTGDFRISRSGDLTNPLVVNYSVGGSATPGADYTALPGTVTIPVGQTSADIIVAPLDDNQRESAETVEVTLLPGDGYTYPAAGLTKFGAVTIIDDEAEGTVDQPYHDVPTHLSATVQAEDFDFGGEGVTYHDTTAGNAFGVYRNGNVDIQSSVDAQGGFELGSVRAGEWLNYTLDVPVTGSYRIETRVASGSSGGTYHLEFDGVNKSGTLTIPNTGSWTTYKDITKTGVSLTAGTHVMKLKIDTSKAGGDVANINYIRLFNDLSATSGASSWTTKAAAPVIREEAQSATYNGKVLVFGGLYKGSNGKYLALNRVDQYDAATNTWTQKANMPEAITHAAVVNLGDRAYFVGGYLGNHPGPGTTHVWIYTFATDSWTAGPDLPQPRGAGTAQLLGNEIHFVGGRDYGRDTDESDHWSLDITNPNATWQTRTPLARPRNHLSSAAINGLWYVFAGSHLEEGDSINSAGLDIYDPTTDSWSRGADLPTPMSHTHQATVVVNGKIITFGGELSYNVPSAEVLEYDPTTNVWSLLGYLPGQRRAATAVAIGNKVYVTGGYGNGVQNTTTWSATLNV